MLSNFRATSEGFLFGSLRSGGGGGGVASVGGRGEEVRERDSD